MALAEREEIYQRILPNGNIEVECQTVVEKDGVEIARSRHNHVVTPIISAGDLAKQAQVVKDMVAHVHTAECKAKYIADQAKIDEGK
jgi:DNA polymerase elongation subunit (family B)